MLEDVQELKVGDRVKIIECSTSGGFHNGKIGIVTRVNHGCSTIPHPNIKIEDGDNCCAYEVEILPTDGKYVNWFKRAWEDEYPKKHEDNFIITKLPKRESKVREGVKNTMADIKKGATYNLTEEGRNVAESNGFVARKIRVIKHNKDELQAEIVNADGSRGAYIFCLKEWHLESATSIMDKLNIITRKIVDGPTRKFVKANYLDNCLNLTEEGKDVIFAIWMSQEANKKLLEKEAEETIQEMEDERDCR